MPLPIMPTTLDDVPAWLRANAGRLRMRILFLADELEAELERRRSLEAVAAEHGIRIVTIPRGLSELEVGAFVRNELALELEREHNERDPAPAAGIPRPKPARCPHCGDRFNSPGELATHVRDAGDAPQRTPHACPVLWHARGGR